VGSFDPITGPSPAAADLRLIREPTEGYFVVQFTKQIDTDTLARLRALGVRPLQYIPDRAYLVQVPSGKIDELRRDPAVRWVGPVEPGWKLSPELGSRPLGDPSRRSEGRMVATVDLFEGQSSDVAEAQLKALDAEVLHRARFGDTQRLTVRATFEQLKRAARLPSVSWIEESAEIVLRNAYSRWVVQTGEPGVTSLWERGLHGEGQIIGHIDGPIYYKSCFFRDPDQETPGPGHRKIIAYRAFPSTGEAHGTHTAGTLAGDSLPTNGSTGYSGLAYRATISHTDTGGISGIDGAPSNLYEFLQAAHEDGARIHSNSWGDDGTGAYTPLVRDVDLFSYDHEDALVIFAVSNGRFVRAPENAKNALAVGASLNGALADEHCSGGTGPTEDGRRKPEIFAPGCDIESALSRSLCGTVGSSGTSMAAPAIAAAGALVRQYFEEGWYPSGVRQAADVIRPSGALVKAVLLNSAVDMTGIPGYPSEQEGWGRVLLENALQFENDRRTLLVLGDVRNASGLAKGISDHLTLRVTASDKPLKLTLAFTEPPAALMAASATVNDLDLELISPDGLRYRGNVFGFEDGWSIPGGEPDPINNVETILIPEPLIGEWRVTVRGAEINQGVQGYALVATGQLAGGSGGSLRYLEHAVDDTGPLGNGDGIADPGETITLSLSLLNLRDWPMNGVSGRLFSSAFERATVGGGTATFPDIFAGGVAPTEAPHFEVTLSPTAACGEVIPFRVRSNHASGSGDSSFGLQVGISPAPGGATACQPFTCADAPLAAGIGSALQLLTDNSDDLRFVWPDVLDAASFELWRSADRDFSTAELVGTLTTTEHVETDGMLTEGSWYYRVRAVNGCGWAAD
jgi:subtilisin family serine protease